MFTITETNELKIILQNYRVTLFCLRSNLQKHFICSMFSKQKLLI